MGLPYALLFETKLKQHTPYISGWHPLVNFIQYSYDASRNTFSLLFTDTAMVFRMGAGTVPQEGRGMYPAPASGRHVGGTACSGRDGRWARTGGWIQY